MGRPFSFGHHGSAMSLQAKMRIWSLVAVAITLTTPKQDLFLDMFCGLEPRLTCYECVGGTEVLTESASETVAEYDRWKEQKVMELLAPCSLSYNRANPDPCVSTSFFMKPYEARVV